MYHVTHLFYSVASRIWEQGAQGPLPFEKKGAIEPFSLWKF